MNEEKKDTFEERNKEAEKNLEKITKKISPFIRKNEHINTSTAGKWYVNPDSVSTIINSNINIIHSPHKK
jgi:hypothetical protein